MSEIIVSGGAAADASDTYVVETGGALDILSSVLISALNVSCRATALQ
jgi:hypothetical protein